MLPVPAGPARRLERHVGAGAVEVVVADEEGPGEVEAGGGVAPAAEADGAVDARDGDVGRAEDGLACVHGGAGGAGMGELDGG